MIKEIQTSFVSLKESYWIKEKQLNDGIRKIGFIPSANSIYLNTIQQRIHNDINLYESSEYMDMVGIATDKIISEIYKLYSSFADIEGKRIYTNYVFVSKGDSYHIDYKENFRDQKDGEYPIFITFIDFSKDGDLSYGNKAVAHAVPRKTKGFTLSSDGKENILIQINTHIINPDSDDISSVNYFVSSRIQRKISAILTHELNHAFNDFLSDESPEKIHRDLIIVDDIPFPIQYEDRTLIRDVYYHFSKEEHMSHLMGMRKIVSLALKNDRNKREFGTRILKVALKYGRQNNPTATDVIIGMLRCMDIMSQTNLRSFYKKLSEIVEKNNLDVVILSYYLKEFGILSYKHINPHEMTERTFNTLLTKEIITQFCKGGDSYGKLADVDISPLTQALWRIFISYEMDFYSEMKDVLIHDGIIPLDDDFEFKSIFSVPSLEQEIDDNKEYYRLMEHLTGDRNSKSYIDMADMDLYNLEHM